jgi:hypothetical protein
MARGRQIQEMRILGAQRNKKYCEIVKRDGANGDNKIQKIEWNQENGYIPANCQRE